MANEQDSDISSVEESNKDEDVDSMQNEEDASDLDDVNDNEDSIVDEADEEKDVTAKKDDILQRISLGKANTKVILKKSKPKKPSTQKLVDEAIQELNERTGSSTVAIQKFIMNKNPELVESRLKLQIKRYVNSCVQDGTMVQIKRSFKLAKKQGMPKKQKLKTKKAEAIESIIYNKTSTKKENTSNKIKDVAKKAKNEKPANKAIKKPVLKKDAEIKKTSKIKPSLPGKSNNAVIKSKSNDLKAANTTTEESKIVKKSTKSKSASVTATPAAVTASGRQKKK